MKIIVTCADVPNELRLITELELVEEEVNWYEVRLFKSIEEYDAKFGPYEGKWQSKGTDHKVVDDYIERKFVKKFWHKELASDSIHEVANLINKILEIIDDDDYVVKIMTNDINLRVTYLYVSTYY